MFKWIKNLFKKEDPTEVLSLKVIGEGECQKLKYGDRFEVVSIECIFKNTDKNHYYVNINIKRI